MSNEDYQDRILTCRDCGNEFTFTAGEQAFFASKGLTNTPSRCPSCRAARRNTQGSYSPRSRSTERYDAICAECGQPTSVPFMPREDRPVYCDDCYQNHRPAPRSRSSSYSSGGRGGSRDRRDHW